MFTSRAEFRLHLRIDNAERRLTPHGRRVGLISDEGWAEFEAEQPRLEEVKLVMQKTRLTATTAEQIERRVLVEARASSPVQVERSSTAFASSETIPQDLSSALGQPLAQLLKRPEIVIEQLAPVLHDLAPRFFERNSSANSASSAVDVSAVHLSSEVRNELKSVETEIKYAGYLDQQQRAIERLKKAEQRRIPGWFDYPAVTGFPRQIHQNLRKSVPKPPGQPAP